ncbi:MAG: non-ribosomal peptide synthetase [Nakamurella sp.]
MDHVETPPDVPPLTMPGPVCSLAERWDEIVRAVPDRTAIHSAPGTHPNTTTASAADAAASSFTFAAADAAAERIAARLEGWLPGDGSEPVALFVDNTAVALIGILALLKLNRVLVMLDRHQPADRLRQITALACVTHCLADRANLAPAQALRGGLTDVIGLDDLVAEIESSPDSGVGGGTQAAPRSVGSGADPVSIVFTSGSTGQPKGVVQTHRQFLNEAASKGERFELTAADRVGVLLPFGFAAGFSALMAALLNGAGVWTYDARDRGVAPFADWAARHRVTAVHCTPHLMRSLTATLPPAAQLSTVRYVCTLGEPVFAGDVAGIRGLLQPTGSFYNETGSSEMGTLAIKRLRNTEPLAGGQVSAGSPIGNKEVRILRSDGSPAAVGEAGDIVVVSDYLSGGYWRDDESNAARFGHTDDGRRMIRQGDLGRIGTDGELMMLGRADAAVKIRGYLVEPSEVEAAILSGDSVLETVVIAASEPPGPTRLIAYVVPDPTVRTESPAGLRRRLRERLPEYMIPGSIVPLARLPRNERGKVDRAQLPPAPSRESTERPTAQWDLVIADIWQRVLGLDLIGLEDDFMALGGDSLIVEEMLAAVRETVDVPLVSTDLLAAPTLRAFTQRVRQGSTSLRSLPDVVLIQSEGDGTPLFCFAGSGGLALSFRPLSRYFRDRRVYSFQAHGLERRALPDRSVERAAARYLGFIRAVQPHGPYLLLGHSFGGLVALELARTLTAAGETVDLVTVLDTYLPRSSGVMPVTATPAPTRDTPPRGAGETTSRRLCRRLSAAGGRWLAPGGTPLRQDLTFRVVRRLRAVTAGVVQFAGQRHFDAFFDQGVMISGRYELRPYQGCTLMIFAENNPNGPAEWEPLLPGPHRFLTVRSEHTSMLRDPHVAEVATAVRDALSDSFRQRSTNG